LSITNVDEDVTADRRITLLELWDGSGKLLNLASGIHDAFGLALFKGVGEGKRGPEEKDKEANRGKPVSVAPHVDAVRKWATGGEVLPQSTVNTLRGLVFGSLEGFIDWDDLGFKKSEVAVAKGSAAIPFRQVSVNFRNQQTQITPSLVMLELPLHPKSTRDKQRTAVALEALLTYDSTDTWDPKDAAVMLPTLMEALPEWAAHVSAQLRDLFAAEKRWDPVVAAAELLALAAYQGGKVTMTDTRADTAIARIWEGVEPPVLEGLHTPFNQLNKQLGTNWKRLQALVRTLSSGTKGGVAGNFVNPLSVQRAVRSLRQRSLKLAQTPPKDLKGPELRTLGDLYVKVKAGYEQSLEAEKAAWIAWRVDVQKSVGVANKISDVMQTLTELIPEFENAGLSAGATLRNLKEVLSATTPTTVDRVLEHACALEESGGAEALTRMALIAKERAAIEGLTSSAETFLAQANTSVQNRLAEEQQRVGPGLKDSQRQIGESLEKLSTAIASIAAVQGPPT
jgi:hypothetical protein